MVTGDGGLNSGRTQHPARVGWAFLLWQTLFERPAGAGLGSGDPSHRVAPFWHSGSPEAIALHVGGWGAGTLWGWQVLTQRERGDAKPLALSLAQSNCWFLQLCDIEIIQKCFL